MTLPGATESRTKGTRLFAEASRIWRIRIRPIPVGSHHNQCFLQVEPPGQPLLQTTQIAFVHLDPAGEQIAPRPHHGAAQFMQPRPGRLIALQPQHSLQPQRADTVLLTDHPPYGLKPQPQRSAGVLKNRPRRHRGLMSTVTTAQQYRPHRRTLSTPTARTAKAIRPAQLQQILSAGLLT